VRKFRLQEVVYQVRKCDDAPGAVALPRKMTIRLRLAGAAALVATLAATAATAEGARPRVSTAVARVCGPGLALQTLADRDRKRVELTPTRSTIGKLVSLPAPKSPPARRSTTFQRHTWRVVAQITSFRAGPNGEIQLKLYDDDDYMLAWLPSRTCRTSRPAAARAIGAVRAQFLAKCGTPRDAEEPSGAVVYVTGVGYWGRPQQGLAKNGAMLSPVLSIEPVAGCGARRR
jgi:hypothetical protein